MFMSRLAAVCANVVSGRNVTVRCDRHVFDKSAMQQEIALPDSWRPQTMSVKSRNDGREKASDLAFGFPVRALSNSAPPSPSAACSLQPAACNTESSEARSLPRIGTAIGAALWRRGVLYSIGKEGTGTRSGRSRWRILKDMRSSWARA
jgi:hypothetical protein